MRRCAPTSPRTCPPARSPAGSGTPPPACTTLLRKGRLALFTENKPGPKGPRKATGQLRARVLELRAAGHSVTEIADALTGEGMPVSAQTA
jgi:hypothetical protein